MQVYATSKELDLLPTMFANAHTNPARPLEQYPWCHEPGQEAYRPLELWCPTAAARGAPFAFADVEEPATPAGYPPPRCVPVRRARFRRALAGKRRRVGGRPARVDYTYLNTCMDA